MLYDVIVGHYIYVVVIDIIQLFIRKLMINILECVTRVSLA